MFLRNVTMLGGALLITYFGAGPLSVDALLTAGQESSYGTYVALSRAAVGTAHTASPNAADQRKREKRVGMAPNSKVLVVEMVLPAGNASRFGALLDLNMLVMTGGRDRTESDFRRLFDAAGLTVTRIIPTLAPLSVIEATCKENDRLLP